MKALIKSVNFGISLLLILSAIAIAYIAIPAFGNKALIVRSGSMQPAIKVGDLVVVKTQHGLLTPQPIIDNPLSSAKISSYKVGETIAFKSQNGSKVFTTHRIVGKEIQEGKVFYRTKGDANDSADENLVAEENVVGKSMFRLPHFGKLFAFAKSNIGFPLLVIFPALLVIILEMVNIYKEIKRQNRLVQVPAPKENFAGLKVIIPVFMSVMVMNNAFAYFSDTETSTGNIFQAAESFCEPQTGTFWASTVISSSQGLRKNGTPVLSERSDPNDALDSPDGVGNPASGFFSLGFGGNIVLHFSSPVLNGEGPDLSFHEITNSRNSYPLEKAMVEVGVDNDTWILLDDEITSQSGVNGVILIDLSNTSGVPSQINYIRITDTTDPAIHASDADGYDLDAVDAITLCVRTSPNPSPTPSPTPSASPGSSPAPTPTPSASPSAQGVVINEFVANGNPEWVEIYNAGSIPVDLTGWYIQDLTATTKSLTGLGTISPNSFATLDINDAYLNNDGDTFYLKDLSNTVIDSHTYGSVTVGQSIGRETDGSGNFLNCATATKGTTNNNFCSP